MLSEGLPTARRSSSSSVRWRRVEILQRCGPQPDHFAGEFPQGVQRDRLRGGISQSWVSCAFAVCGNAMLPKSRGTCRIIWCGKPLQWRGFRRSDRPADFVQAARTGGWLAIGRRCLPRIGLMGPVNCLHYFARSGGATLGGVAGRPGPGADQIPNGVAGPFRGRRSRRNNSKWPSRRAKNTPPHALLFDRCEI